MLSFGIIAGCQNNSERDLIARDRRMQEDQIYALQDYINQYQRLLCQYRSENASLRRQLSANYTTIEPQSRESQLSTPSRLTSPEPNTAPQFKTPETPGVKQRQIPAAPAPDMTPPDVPPLKSTTSVTLDPAGQQVATDERRIVPKPDVVQASYDAPESCDQAHRDSSAGASSTPSNPISELMISGEIVANVSGGPRLMVDVVPFDVNGQIQPFEGSTSIMLLATDENGKQHNRGRWDFSPEEVHAAINSATGRPTMRYFIELPRNDQPGGSVQLWVRLVPRIGDKLLTHTSVDLTKPGVFSSQPGKLEKSSPNVPEVAATNYTEAPPATADSSTSVPEINTTNTESAWVVAQPGKPANLPPETSDATGGGWRASTQPVPAFVATSTERAPNIASSMPVTPPEHAAPAATEAPAKRPSWSSERSSDSARTDVSRPTWSATR